METTLIIDGGLGRVITAIPALEKFVRKNPKTTIIIFGWISILLGNKILANNLFDHNTKGLYQIIKDTKIIKPEPYYNSHYLNGRISLIDAWNQEINNDNEKMPLPNLYISQEEKNAYSKMRSGYKKVICFQPFGSTTEFVDNKVKDNTLRSLNEKTTIEIVKSLKKQGYGIWLMTNQVVPFLDNRDFIQQWPNDPRGIVAMISHCDYFLGIDSSGQHIARSLNIPGSVIMGGTNTTNVTYPDHFYILNDKPDKQYMPYRVGDFDFWHNGIINDNILNFSDKEIKSLSLNIVKHIKKTTK